MENRKLWLCEMALNAAVTRCIKCVSARDHIEIAEVVEYTIKGVYSEEYELMIEENDSEYENT